MPLWPRTSSLSFERDTAHWGWSQPQLSGASIWGGFFESLKHTKQDLRIIEFKNQV